MTKAAGTTQVGGVILAAGRSTRLQKSPLPLGERVRVRDTGRPKQLLEIDGEPMVRRMVRTALDSGLSEVVVVLGHLAEDIAAAVDDLGVRTMINSEYVDGQSTSVRAGISALSSSIVAAMFLPADQPRLTSETIDQLIAAWSPGSIVVPVHGRRRGSPVLFGREYFAELEALEGDTGGRALLPLYEDRLVTVEVEDPAELADIDTVEDFQRLRKN